MQFVSKSVEPPFRDGSKCLVRDLCLHLRDFEPHVLSSLPAVAQLGSASVAHRVYAGAGSYRPAFAENLRAAAFLATVSRAELWHFVFAPNKLSSSVGRALRKWRRIPCLQTIASPPLSFSEAPKLLFGDVVVAQSAWTKSQFERALGPVQAMRIEEIPPPAPLVSSVSCERQLAARRALGVSEGVPLFLYPGDLEVSEGAQLVAKWAPSMREQLPTAQVVLAYRNKTPQAAVRAEQLRRLADPALLSVAADVQDIHALVATATAVLFPVDNLYGKVDLPIVLLEAMRLGTPVLALNQGPLGSLKGATLLSGEARDWLAAAQKVATDPAHQASRAAAGRQAVAQFYDPQIVAARYEELYRELLGSAGASP